MTVKEIIDGLQFTIDMFLFDGNTGETKTKQELNDMDRTTVDACEGAIKILKEVPTGKWINNTHTSHCGITFLDYECDCCHGHTDTPYDYCPNCGTKMMVEEQQGEES